MTILGASVIRMFEHFLTTDVFQSALKLYLKNRFGILKRLLKYLVYIGYHLHLFLLSSTINYLLYDTHRESAGDNDIMKNREALLKLSQSVLDKYSSSFFSLLRFLRNLAGPILYNGLDIFKVISKLRELFR